MSGQLEHNATVAVDDSSIVLGIQDGRPAAVLSPRCRRRRIAAILLTVVLLLVVLTGVAVYLVSERLGNNVARVPNVFGPLNVTDRPPAGAGLTFLLVGTDSRSPDPITGTDAAAGVDGGSQRSDVIMLAQLAPDKKSASVVSIPRDSWVNIPGQGKNKINAAYAFGGASLLTHTIEQLTNVHVDHFAVIDFAGFQSMVDAVDGIDLQVAKTTQNAGVTFRKGPNHLTGGQALAYVRQRYGLPGGDLDRAKRQQNALRALLAKAVSNGTLADPIRLYRLLDAISRSVSVDDTLTNGGFRQLGIDASGLLPAAVTFLTTPVQRLGREGTQSVVYLDTNRMEDLWLALRSGTASVYGTKHPADVLGIQPS